MRNTIYPHLFTSVLHKFRCIFYNFSIFISHSHSIDISMTRINRFSIIKNCFFSIAINKILTKLFIITRSHNRSIIMHISYYFIINSFSKPQFIFKNFCGFYSKILSTIKPFIVIIYYCAASTSNIIFFINWRTRSMKNSI